MSEKIIAKIPLQSERLCLQEFNVVSSPVRAKVKRSYSKTHVASTGRSYQSKACDYCSTYQKCRICEILKDV